MASNVMDSVLFRDSFGTPAMRAVFDDYELIRKYVEVEVALAKAQARCGVIPEAAAKEIAEKCNADTLDFDLLRHETEIVGYLRPLPVCYCHGARCRAVRAVCRHSDCRRRAADDGSHLLRYLQ